MPARVGATNLVIHMGLPKTGTTFLQNHVFSSCGQIADFGKTPSYRQERPHVYEALKIVASAPEAEFRVHLPGVARLLMQESADAAVRKPGSSCRLLSYEGFFHPNSIPPTEIHDRLVAIFGEFKIFVTIRHQFTWIASYYLYKFYRFLHGGGPSFDVWAKRARKRPRWNVFACCDYWRVIDQLVHRAGRERVLVEPMEGLIQAPGDDALRRLADFLAVDVNALATTFSQARPTKERIDELGFLLGRVLYESQKASLTAEELLQLKQLFRKVHRELHGNYDKANVPFDVVERSFSDAEREAIRDGNTALSRQFGQDLGRFGYPVREAS
jgi:hypothetical protein